MLKIRKISKIPTESKTKSHEISLFNKNIKFSEFLVKFSILKKSASEPYKNNKNIKIFIKIRKFFKFYDFSKNDQKLIKNWTKLAKIDHF